jgi:hypothetical protein
VRLIRYQLRYGGFVVVLLLALTIVGCTNNSAYPKLQVIPLNNQNVVALSPDDVVRIMRQAGFSDPQILQYGTDLRNGLSQSGAAQVKAREKVEAIFAAHGDYIYVTTRLRGSFIYNVKKGRVGSSRRPGS